MPKSKKSPHIVPLDEKDPELLLQFIAGMGSSSDSFRYFVSRPISVIDNHLVTLVGLDEFCRPISYGHLDPEGDIVWLGICVSEGQTGKGFGRQMMERLLAEAHRLKLSAITLSVDSKNRPAISLYRDFGFEYFDRKGLVSFYRCQLPVI